MLPNNCFILTKEEIKNLQYSLLFGYAWTDTSLIFNTQGINSYLEKNVELPEEGRFCGVFRQKDRFLIYGDITAQETIYYFYKDNDWAISNSFLLLAEKVSRNNKISIYPPSIIGFHLKEGVHIGEQLISHNTAVSEIKILPSTHKIVFDLQTEKFFIKKIDYISVLEKDNLTYEEEIINMISRGSGALQALMEHNLPLNLFLSGGYDSRVVLGMLSHTDINNDLINLYSHVSKTDDFKSACLLAEYFNLPINNNTGQKSETIDDFKLSAGESIRQYLLSCGSVYLPCYISKNYKISNNHVIRLTGDHVTDTGFFSGKGIFNGGIEKIGKDIHNYLKDRPFSGEVVKDFFSVFDDLGLDINDNLSHIAYYHSIRSRHHCGRNWYKSLGNTFLFTPLVQKSMLKANFLLGKQDINLGKQKLFVDIFSAIGSWALQIPFEKVEKAPSSELISLSRFKGGCKIVPNKIEVYGEPKVSDNSNLNESSLLSVNVKFNDNDDMIKDCLERLFYKAEYVKATNYFNKSDFSLANLELMNRKSLSHDYRKTMHIIHTEILLSIIQNSGG